MEKFDWKEFIKPTRLKIIIAVILSVAFIPFIYYYTGSGVGIWMPPFGGTMGSILMYLLSLSNSARVYRIFYLNLILGLIVSYLISCIILFLYRKTKSR